MENNAKKRRIRKVSSWITEAVQAIDNEEEIIAGKKIVLKVLRYMEDNHMSQKELADKLDVSPQYINKFLHGQECDIKVSTAIRYGKLLNLKLIDIPDSDVQEDTAVVNEIYLFKNCILKPYIQKPYSYDCISNRVINQLYSYN